MPKIRNKSLHLLTPLLFLLSYIIPKNKNLFIFGCMEQSHYRGNPRYLFEYCSNNPEIDARFFTKKVYVAKKIKNNGHKVETTFFKQLILLLRARYIFIEVSILDISPFYFLFGRFNIIQLWHGSPLKKIQSDTKLQRTKFHFVIEHQNKSYKLITAQSDEVKKILSNAFLSSSVEVTGYPRNDIFFNNYSVSDKELLPDSKKTFLYAPTFRDSGDFTPFTNQFLDKLNSFLKENNYLFLLREHPLSKSVHTERFSNIKDVSKISDIQPILAQTDVLISDYSSIPSEFVLTDNPMIFYVFDYDTYVSKDRELYYDLNEILPGPFAKTQEDLFDLIRSVDSWFKDPDYQKKYQVFKDKFNKYKDGNSCKRILDYLTKGKCAE
jgi:CDP-glycerol glycerophosphotransferase (TagB/SpsB family)